MKGVSGSAERALAAALAMRDAGRSEEALAHLRSASDALPPDHTSRSWLHIAIGELELETGDSATALNELRHALQIQREVSQAMADSLRRADEIELENGLLCRLPLLEKIRSVPGWLTDAEADLLSAVTVSAATLAGQESAALMEIGSYCGKSTLTISLTLRVAAAPKPTLFAIDPHEDYAWAQGKDTYEALRDTLERFGVADRVTIIRARSQEVEWGTPLALLFVDALHHYEAVADDSARFGQWIVPGGYLALHDYSAAFPGVMRVADELRRSGEYLLAGHRDGLLVLRRAVAA